MEFFFKFEGVFHTENAPECKELTQKCTNEIINTMRDCNNPDIEPSQMSEMLLKKKDLTSNLKKLVKFMKGEVEVIQDPDEQKGSIEVYKETKKLVKELIELQQLTELDGEGIKKFCTGMVDVIKHVLDIVILTDKWSIKISLDYIDQIYKSMINAVKSFKELGPLDKKELTNLYNNAGFLTNSIAQFTSTRACVYPDERSERMKEDSIALRPSFDNFLKFVSGVSDDKTSVTHFKQILMEIKDMLKDPAQFSASIDVTQKDNLEDVYNNFKDVIDDPTLPDDDKDSASLALLEGFEGRAIANLHSTDPRRARAATAVVKKVRENKVGKRKKEMLMVARSLAKDMKAICDHLEPLDNTVNKEMNVVTDELLGNLCDKLSTY
ncbi:hypothetical protein EDI_312430 [Entamoeba dispar SAW760]|uniref:Uncharacterized protein n=1 Tax=Entamoeba dispar (strain ATCC PRA-260 / SAW760) TaxID=370354 RepID=B0E9A6_ENTDS|nr:uncharacterized protein EDI_312430 [Entamoeba dispar SAW760]EDR28890.1 hypothetical protein EDI_312430 [Entamoeba dispar SAW760]|eukprot:EDR28890.1 hypothetical protein EDI_312430 [Entamoeba dispar SAW760]